MLSGQDLTHMLPLSLMVFTGILHLGLAKRCNAAIAAAKPCSNKFQPSLVGGGRLGDLILAVSAATHSFALL